MINEYLKEEFAKQNVDSVDSLLNVLREESQKLVLFSLSKTDFFNNVAFYGGTCLRIFHNLNRYSEDLDFAVTSPNTDINLDLYMQQCINDLKSFGLDAIVSTKPDYDIGEMRRRYIKISLYEIIKEYLKIEVNKEKLLSLKVEISTIYIDGAKYEQNVLMSPFLATIRCYDYQSLFAGKLNALILRNWRNREKGRDYYDFMFYLSHKVKFNLTYFKNKLSNSKKENCSNVTLDEIKTMLKERFEDTNYDSVISDIKPFVINNFPLESFKKELFIASVDHIECE